MKAILLTSTSIIFIVFSGYSQYGFGDYFFEMDEKIDLEVERLKTLNNNDSLFNLNEWNSIELAADYFKNNKILFRLLVEDGISDCLKEFNLVFFTFYTYGIPSHAYSYCIYKHEDLGFYKGIKFDVEDYNDDGMGNRTTMCKYFKKFPEELRNKTNFAQFESGYNHNFRGLSIFFETGKIKSLELLHNMGDYLELNEVTKPY